MRKKKKAERKPDASKRGKPWGNLGAGSLSFSFCYWSRVGKVSALQQKDRRNGRRRWRGFSRNFGSQQEKTGLK